MISTARAATAIALVIGLLAGCSTTPPTPEARDELFRRAEAERQEWKNIDPNMEAFVRQHHGFAFFPEVTKAGAGFGGGYGRGIVYEQGQHIGYADLTQGSVGFQLGGQTYSEVIVFQDKSAMDRFKRNPMDFGATASAVIATTGASTNARFVDGVAVFVRPIAGAMAEASIGGQRMTYLPK
jgi:lipid-binding SYLF domain-containing protein